MTHYAMLIDLNTCVGCNACMAACAMENQTPVWEGKWRTYVHDKEIGTAEDISRRFFPRLCNHCSNPPCMTVCPTGATYQLDNGIVKVNDATCMGCGACAMACPYEARYSITYGDIDTGKEVCRFEHTFKAVDVTFSADGHLALSAGLDKTVRVWDLENQQ